MFGDRKDAAEKLAFALERYRDNKTLVLGIPRGGVETAYYVAKYLNADFSLVIARKLGYPFNPETAFGALAEDGSVYISPDAMESVTQEEMNEILLQQKKEVQRRLQYFRDGKPLPEMKGKTVIIVDDGVATGATLFATIELCKNKEASKVVVATPVSGIEMKKKLQNMVDNVVILETPEFYNAVSQVYGNFRDLTDEEVISFVNKWEKDRFPHA